MTSHVTRNEADHIVLVLEHQQVESPFVPTLDTLNQRAIQFVFAHPGRIHRQCRHPLRELVRTERPAQTSAERSSSACVSVLSHHNARPVGWLSCAGVTP